MNALKTHSRTILAAIIILLSLLTVAFVELQNSGATTTPQSVTESGTTTEIEGLPACLYEDASEYDVCFWDASEQGNGDGRDMIVFNHGTTVFYPETGELAVWSDDRNDVVTHKIQ